MARATAKEEAEMTETKGGRAPMERKRDGKIEAETMAAGASGQAR